MNHLGRETINYNDMIDADITSINPADYFKLYKQKMEGL